MFSLILKDIILQKKVILFNLIYGVILFFAFQSPTFAPTLYVMGSTLIAYTLIMGACAYDGKSNIDILFNSLPMKRSNIVAARYISTLVFVLIGLIIMGGEGFIMKFLGFSAPPRLINVEDVVGVMISLGILVSLYFPVFFKFGYIKSKVFNLVIFFIFFALPPLAINLYKGTISSVSRETIEAIFIFIEKQPSWLLLLVTASIFLLVIFISYCISCRVYKRKEF